MAKTGQKLTKEDFKKIKDLQFAGEEILAIHEKTDRSEMTIRRAMKVNSLEEYQAYSASENARYGKNKGIVTPRPLVPGSVWGELRLVKEKFDSVISDIIVEAVEARTKAILEENKKLKRANLDLENENKRLREPDFVKLLQGKLEQQDKQ